MKEKKIKTTKKLSLEKFRVAELKNSKMIIGGDGGGTAITVKTGKTGKVEEEV
jgi:hypothetical protein